MIGFVLAAIALIAVLAVVVGIADAAQAPVARMRAAERRQRWEARQPEFHGTGSSDDGWDDD